MNPTLNTLGSISTYGTQFGADDVKQQREHVEAQAAVADPGSNACRDVSQHRGQSVLAAEESS